MLSLKLRDGMSIRSGKNRLTKDNAYNASLPNHFTPMLEEDRYGDRSDVL